MKTLQIQELGLDELAATTVRLGRDLEQMARAVLLGGNSRDYGIVCRALGPLADRRAFDPRCADALAAVADIIEDDLRSEIDGSERNFVETYCDEDGVFGEVVERPVYTARGEALLDLKRTFEAFLSARDATLDRIAADRALRRLMSS